MISKENLDKLRIKCLGHYKKIAKNVSPQPVSGQFVGQVLKGEKSSNAVVKSALEYVKELEREAEGLNKGISQL